MTLDFVTVKKMKKEIKKQAYLKLFENEKLLEDMCYMLYANKFTKEEIEAILHIKIFDRVLKK